MHLKAGLLAATGAAVLAGGVAQAPTRTIGSAAERSAMDPPFHNLGPDNAKRRPIFENFVVQDENPSLHPALAVSWEPVSATN